MYLIIKLFFALFMSAWRRCFGSDGWKLPVIKYRVVQHIVACLVEYPMFVCFGYGKIQAILMVAVLQGLFWSLGHGEIYDFGHSNPVDKERYNKYWYWKYVKSILPESAWYGFFCDWLLMTIRYSLPSILFFAVSFNVYSLFMGIVVSSVYGLCWCFYDCELNDKPTELAEWIAGFCVGLLCV